MCIRLTVQFLCSRDDIHKCSHRAKKPGIKYPGSSQNMGIPQSPKEDLLLEDALAFEEDGLMPCDKGGCVVDQATFDALPREWLRCYKGQCSSCLMHSVRYKMAYDPEYDAWSRTKSDPSLRLSEEHAVMLLEESLSRQRDSFERYLKFPLLSRDDGPGPRSLHKDGILYRLKRTHGSLDGVRGRENETIVDHETGKRRLGRGERW